MALTRPILNGELKVAKLVESDSPALLNQRVASILNKDISDKTYIYYALQTPRFVNSMSDAMAGSDPPNIGVKTLEKLKIPLPATKFEQEAIAKALSDADAYIESLDKLIEKKRLIKKGVMQELLTGARRLPGFKEKWNATSCSELIMEMIDNRGKTPPLSNIGFSLLEANAIKDGYRSPDLSKVGKFVDQNVFTNWFRDGHPKVGDILLVTVGSAGVSCLIDKEIVCIAQNIIAVRLKKMVDPKYFYYFTQTEKFKKQVAAVLMGAVQPSLKVPHLMKFEINIPSTKEEQTEIGNLIWDIDSYICEQEQKLTKARQIKQGMMQELLTGRIRLV